MTSLTRDDYTFAWICALPLEMAAARVMLDKIHSPMPKQSADPNAYEVGELNGHYIAIACLPAGVYGTVSAATVVSRMRLTFPRLQYGLIVGIGGGVPDKIMIFDWAMWWSASQLESIVEYYNMIMARQFRAGYSSQQAP